ncbi:MAG: DUF805 domain-containing protein [Firmicutes bacterium]|nr:DUF805 domain-containing protein [Bacillota bacterium]
MLKAYGKYWKGYVDFSGVTSRKDYWLAVLANWLVIMILSLIGGVLAGVQQSSGSASALMILSYVILAFSLANILPALAIIVRRLRDAGCGWGNIFWLFLPFFGAIILIVLLCKPKAVTQPAYGQPLPTRSGSQPTMQQTGQPALQNTEPALEPNPGRAVWVGVFLIVLPFVLYLIHCIPRMRLIYCSNIFSFAATGMMGISVYLMLQKGTKWKILAIVSTLMAILLFHVGDIVSQINAMRGGWFEIRMLYQYLFLRPARTGVIFYVIKAVIAAAAGLLFGLAFKNNPPKKQVWLTSLCTSLLVFVFNLIYILARSRGGTPMSFSLALIAALLLALMLLFAPPALFALCNMKTKTIRLHGWGLVWCWLCVLGMLGAIGICIATMTHNMTNWIYSSQLIMSVMALVGFIMLLAKKRAGWFVVLFSVFTVLMAQFSASFSGVIQGGRAYSSLMVGALAGALNPLLTWFSILSAWKASDPSKVRAAVPYSTAPVMPNGQTPSFAPQTNAAAFAPRTNVQTRPVDTPQRTATFTNTQNVQYYMQLADQYAHVESLFAENQEKKELEAKLLAGGPDAQAGITAFLVLCGSGRVKYGWWNGAAALTSMLRKIGGSSAEKDLLRLKNLSTNIWEYHTQIKDTAEKELLELKKESGGYAADGRIPAEYAYAELLRLQNVGSPEKRLEEFFAMQNSADAWSKKDRAFYYFIGGGAARVLYPYNKSNLAFYAAQVNTDPNPTSVGWQHLRETEGITLAATQESARQMHEKYPMPHSIEEAKNYLIM